MTNEISTISIIGGTGALGSGLARRWAQAGYEIVIGSRAAAKAEQAAAILSAESDRYKVSGFSNLQAAERGDIVVMTVPFAHQEKTLLEIKTGLVGKILVDTTVPLVPPKVARVQLPDAGCAALISQRIVGDDTTVVSAFQNIAADVMSSKHIDECDVLVTGDQADAREVVVKLAQQAGFLAWHAGPLANSAATEALTSVLIFLNRRFSGAHTGIKITGIPAD
jgi:NADPH-dependent F420 reductase